MVRRTCTQLAEVRVVCAERNSPAQQGDELNFLNSSGIKAVRARLKESTSLMVKPTPLNTVCEEVSTSDAFWA